MLHVKKYSKPREKGLIIFGTISSLCLICCVGDKSEVTSLTSPVNELGLYSCSCSEPFSWESPVRIPRVLRLLNRFKATSSVGSGQSTQGWRALSSTDSNSAAVGSPEHCPIHGRFLLLTGGLEDGGQVRSYQSPPTSSRHARTCLCPLLRSSISIYFTKSWFFSFLFLKPVFVGSWWLGIGEYQHHGDLAFWKTSFLPSSPYCSESGHQFYVDITEENIRI